MTKNSFLFKLVVLVLVALLSGMSSIVLSATSSARYGSLAVVGLVEINGEKAVTGGTVFSDSMITTGKQSSTSISLASLGRVELYAESAARLTFNESFLSGAIEKGEVRVSTPTGVSARFTTARGVVQVDGSQSTSFVVTVIQGQTDIRSIMGTIELISGTECSLIVPGRDDASNPSPQSTRSRKRLIIWLAAIGSGAATAIWLVTKGTDRNDEMDFGGTVVIPSPR